jgi:hypothetical protein
MGVPVDTKKFPELFASYIQKLKVLQATSMWGDSVIGTSITSCFDFLILGASEVVVQSDCRFIFGSLE